MKGAKRKRKDSLVDGQTKLWEVIQNLKSAVEVASVSHVSNSRGISDCEIGSDRSGGRDEKE